MIDEGCNRRVIIHCCTVRAIADRIAEGIPSADSELVTAGALLHDIGRAETHSIFHANIGADIINNLGLPIEIENIVRKHTGAGLDDEDSIELGLPLGDYIPSTIEEKIVAHADNMVSDNHLVRHDHSSSRLINKGAYRGADRMEKLHEELSKLFGRDLDTLVDELGEVPVLKCYSMIPPE